MKAAWLYWKLAIFRVSGKTAMAIALSLAQALNGVLWSDFTPTQKFVTVVLALGTGWAIIDAFLDSTMGELKKRPNAEGLALPGDTQIIRRNEVAPAPAEPVKSGP